MNAGSSIDYDAMTQDALRGVVRAVLDQVARTGLPGDHHFYVAFSTQAPGVVMSRRLKEKYPDEMMIVLQHRFWDLAATEEGFEVKLTFDGIPERLCIPYLALRVFHDPSVRFTLQFGEHGLGEDGQEGGGRRRREGSGDRRSRGRQRLRSDVVTDVADDGSGAQAGEKGGQGAPAPFTPRAVETTRPVAAPAAEPAVPATAPAQQGAGQEAGSQQPGSQQQAGGAKVFSLDQFRNKK
jgi:hypothetical protein